MDKDVLSYTAPVRSASPRHSARKEPSLDFRPITFAALPLINRLLQQAHPRTCDYTIGGIYMWIDYFHYTFAVLDETLFIKGRAEDHRNSTAFSLPVGPMPLPTAVGLITRYCEAHGLVPRFSGVPEPVLPDLLRCFPGLVEQLTDWTDYLYLASDLASLRGKRFNKKRNHVNRFMTDNPRCTFTPLTPEMIPEVAEFYATLDSDSGPTALVESRATEEVLRNWERYPFEGGVLRDGSRRIVAFTVGEVIGDTYYDHIEKIDHSVAGAGEALVQLMAMRMVEQRGVVYINREEDCGDEGLRRAKLSWQPSMMIRKYNVLWSRLNSTV